MEKTCGTCYYSTPRKYGHWTTNDLICLRHAVSTHSERHHITECGWGISGPRGWRPKEPDPMKQRYQQLEQVARDAIKALDDGDWLEADALRDQLTELGVSVDEHHQADQTA